MPTAPQSYPPNPSTLGIQSSSVSRLPELDFIKAVMIVLMVAFHLVYIGNTYPYAKQLVYTFHMPAFLVVSGYLMNVAKPAGAFARTVMGFAVPYLAMESGYTVMASLLPIREHIDLLTPQVFADKLLLHPLGPYWYLHTLIVCASVYYLAFLNKTPGTAAKLFATAVGFILLSLLGVMSLSMSLYFLLGAVVRQSTLGFRQFFRASWLSLPAFCLLALSEANLHSNTFAGLIVVYMSISICLVVFPVLPGTARRLFLFLGRNTLPIFLFSPIFTILCKSLLPFLAFDPTGMLFLLLSLLISISGSLLIGLVIDALSLSRLFCGRRMLSTAGAVLLLMMLASCSETKYVADGDYLLDRTFIHSDSKHKNLSTTALRPLVKQKENSRWFSWIKLPLRTYSLSGRDTTKWINRTLRNMGEAPVIYDSMATAVSAQTLCRQVRNMGFLNATVDVSTAAKGKKIAATYNIHPGQPYYIRLVRYDIRDSLIAHFLQTADFRQRGLRLGMMFNVDNLDAERKRITQLLVNNGYYHFNKDFITYRADSVPGGNAVDLTLVLHRYRDNTVSDAPHQQYHISQVTFRSSDAEDSVIHLRQKVLRNNTFIEEGNLYSARDLQNTYNHFGRLGAVRYTNITFREHPQQPLLDCDVQVRTNKPSSLSFQPEGTNTAGDLGAAVSLTYQNNNIFRGSENLSIQLRAAYEAIKGLEGYSNSNFLEYAVDSKLSFPRFVAPFLSSSFRRRINATSELSVLYDRQNRPEFWRRVFSVGWSYKWNDQRHHDRYQIDLLDLNYISMPWISPTFQHNYLDDVNSRNAILRYNYEDLFIMKSGFSYTYNNGKIAIKVHAETAGNLLSLMSHTMGFHQNEAGQYTFVDLAYAQYVQSDVQLTRNIQLDYNNHIVLHFGLGMAYPYGNSSILPFEKRYFSGGANSVRGWAVRSLGPGAYRGTDGNIDFINQTGDIKLDMNMEYRTHLFWKLGGAFFVDAGNIWTFRNYDVQPGGQFRFSEFWRQIAASYGIGMRLNFDYFIVRFDMGMKAVNPVYTSDREHFPLLHPSLSRDFAFHFAVGLPF